MAGATLLSTDIFINCRECGTKNRHPCTEKCYWCLEDLCIFCNDYSGGGHFCSGCGKRKSYCQFQPFQDYCLVCGKSKPTGYDAQAAQPDAQIRNRSGYKSMSCANTVMHVFDKDGQIVGGGTTTGNFSRTVPWTGVSHGALVQASQPHGFGQQFVPHHPHTQVTSAGPAHCRDMAVVVSPANQYASSPATTIPDEVLLLILQNVFGLHDLMSFMMVCKKWRILGHDNSVWKRMTILRWPSISQRSIDAHNNIDWFSTYKARHAMWSLDSVVPPIAVEDRVKPECTIDFRSLNPRKCNARVLDSRICDGCGELLIVCSELQQTRLFLEHGILASSDLDRHYFGRPGAYHVRKAPTDALDWGFSPWYFGLITREAATQILKKFPSGTFLVRESQTRPQDYCLSVTYNNEAHHIRINWDQAGFSIGAPFSFESVVQLVEFYRHTTLGVHFSIVQTKLQYFPPMDSAVVQAVLLQDQQSDTRVGINSHAYILANKAREEVVQAFRQSVDLLQSQGIPVPHSVKVSMVELGISESLEEINDRLCSIAITHG
eukprot:m.577588 g.577588  ORF g.577588 m.577588 type:complete len:547 (+) comp22297_c0_seq2:339-1979(+)